jgi:hypothetical protein
MAIALVLTILKTAVSVWITKSAVERAVKEYGH